ncbi:hypothetical protein U2F26_33280 [Micromonospora sp. 4G57]|uniref:Uncharacterized protein n=1 Tax=Micromonospora sicca TaxID=2202420 RepID=A0ABU5JNN6_9ACTN|nr:MULTISPECIES: hypothetical protein [unclassified Micromonospora]MDZ5447524.1 hypothetical protein [Micromonospora sp. 4G57]MDZ5494260.1 hypothetical protein [Micromonospora sp. 4G53]
MLAGLEVPPAVEAERVITAVPADLRSGDHRGVVVDSLLRVGKSTLVARAGIAELLDAHPSTETVHLNVPVKFPDGWEANQSGGCASGKTKGANMTTAARRGLSSRRGDSGHRHSRAYLAEVK